MSEIAIWTGNDPAALPAHATEPDVIGLARQLTEKERQQLINAYKSELYEMASSFVWSRSMAALKRELSNLGMTFLAELLGRPDIQEEDNVLEVVTDKEAIRLAHTLGMINATEEIRLRHSQELVSFFTYRDIEKSPEPMHSNEAVLVLRNCVANILAKPSIQTAQKFADFRRTLESTTLSASEASVSQLVASPYFFRRLALSVLLSGAKTNIGAKLEHCLSNLNIILPLLWDNLKDAEKWQVGTTYSEVYADGLQTQMHGLKQALLKVHGFDFVPENLRSQTFIQAANAVLKAHEAIDNFYNEEPAVAALDKLGTVIPPPALAACFTALLCVTIGNSYGVSWYASPIAKKILLKQPQDRWRHYLDQVLPTEPRILEKLGDDKPRAEWIAFLKTTNLTPEISLKDSSVRMLVRATFSGDQRRFDQALSRLRQAYYGQEKSS